MANSFEPIFGTGASSGPAWLSAIPAQAGFAADPRFVAGGVVQEDPGDPVLEQALADAFAAGAATGRAEAQAEFTRREAAQAALRLSITRLDEELQQRLALRMAETVSALCEATMAPLGTDRAMLERRCINAAVMLGDDIVDATLRLHPDDIDLLGRDFAATWHMLPDPALERGTVSFDTPEGAVIDGPQEWRAALREALGLPSI